MQDFESFILEAKCWDGYKRAGMKKKGNRMVPNCVPEEKTPMNCGCGQDPCVTYGEEATEIPEPTEKKLKKIVKSLKKSVKSHASQHKTIQKVLDKDATNESLKDWFGKGPKGDWVRMDTKGNIKGDCAREPGEGKPKCLPRSKAHSMSKKDRASATRRKRANDPQTDRPGTGNKPINVKTEEVLAGMLLEKSKPNNPKLWSKAKSLARSKFDVYPSAYANGWAAKWYKSKGGTWRSG